MKHPRLLLSIATALVFTVIPSASAAVTTASDIDLVVTRIEPLTAPICAGTTPTFRADILNSGLAESGAFSIRWYADALIFDGGHYSIPAGAVDTHDHIWTELGQGQHTLTFVADFDDRIAETNEDNN